MCILGLCFRRTFYSAQEKATVVLSRHFDLFCNDGYHGGDRALITILGGWQVPLKVVPWWSCPSLHPIGGMGSVWQSIDMDVRIGKGPISHLHVRWKWFQVAVGTWGLARRHCSLRESDASSRVPERSRWKDPGTTTVFRTILRGVTCGLSRRGMPFTTCKSKF